MYVVILFFPSFIWKVFAHSLLISSLPDMSSTMLSGSISTHFCWDVLTVPLHMANQWQISQLSIFCNEQRNKLLCSADAREFFRLWYLNCLSESVISLRTHSLWEAKLQFTYSPLTALSYPFALRPILCKGKDALIHCACIESFTNALLIWVTDLISWMPTYPDTFVVFVILKGMSTQKEWKKKYKTNQLTQIIWMTFVMWNYNTVHIFIIISHDQ